MIDKFITGQWYTNSVRAFQVIAVDDTRVTVRFMGETETTRMSISTIARLVKHIDGPPAASPTPSASEMPAKRKRGPKAQTNDNRTYRTAETTPVILDLIRKNGRSDGGFLTHEEIVRLILDDPKGQYLVAEAQRIGNPDPPAKIAGNMLDFLSKSITEGKSAAAPLLERKKIGGKWAYRPR